MGNLFTFRRYKKEEGNKVKKSKHPKLIVDETSNNFGFMGITHERKRGNHKNFPLTKNPDPLDKEPSFVRLELRYDKKKNFSEPIVNYVLDEKDLVKLIPYLEKLKRNKKKK